MPRSLIVKDLLTELTDLHIGRCRVKCENRRQFFIGIRVSSANTIFPGYQDLVPSGIVISAISAITAAFFPTIIGFMVPLARRIKVPSF